MNNTTILALGPYVGDWEHEITVFIPYMRWISKVINVDDIFLSTHSNRLFLYDWIDKDKMWSEYENITREELKQTGYIHQNLKPKDFNILLKQFKKYIQSNIKGKIENYFLNYSKNKSCYPIYKKIFQRVEIINDIKDKDYVAFIPDNRYDKSLIYNIYDKLIKEFSNVKVIGDMKTHLSKENVILKNTDYLENGYKYIIKYIMNASVVICPISHWTFLCNLQKKPVFSWGTNVGIYAENGIYNFGNKCFTIPVDDNADMIVNTFKYFYERLVK